MKLNRKISVCLFTAIVAAALVAGCTDQVPRQIHLAVQGDASATTTVSWVTTDAQDTALHRVEYGVSPGSYTLYADGTSQGIPNENAGFVHEVELTGLADGTTYYYRCGDPTGGWSSEHGFYTAPAGAQDLTFLAVGDMGISVPAKKIVALMDAEDPDFVLHAGDLSYANGFTPTWDTWFTQIEPVAADALYMPSVGNHEVEPTLGLSTYLGRFALPNNERWYSYDWGNTHVVSLDTESDTAPGSDQYVWADADLAEAASDPDTEWIVVFFHRPPYSASPAHGSDLTVRQDLCPLFDTYGVDIVLNGHDHDYERTYPLNNQVVVDSDPNTYTQPGGTVYVVTGGAGGALYASGSDYWTAYAQSVYEYVRIDILASGTLHLQAISNVGVLLDECWINK